MTTTDPVDHLDGTVHTIDQLLDLQDDLGRLTVWLLDNWRSDWPTPELHHRPVDTSRVLDLAVPCCDRADFDYITQALDVPTTQRCGLVLAVKTFGRVGIEAFTLARPEVDR
jgi:hypothetical protein